MAFGKTSKDPFSTRVGHLIENSTVGTVHTEDWGQFMNICDFINTTEEGPKEAVKAIKRRIFKNYNHKEVRLSLSLLDMCMQNCCVTFQALVVKKDFCKVLVKQLKPKYNLPIVMQNKILHFIMTWSKGLEGGSIDVSDVKEVYLDLLKKGIVFPCQETNGEMSCEDHVSSSQNTKQPLSCTQSKTCPIDRPPASSTVLLAPEQIGKLYSELDMVKTNVTAMSLILLENAPDTTNLQDMDLLQKLNTTCRSMQERIMELLVAVQNDDVTAELIQVNDDLNNAFLRYERFSRNRIRLTEDHIRQADCTEIETNKPSAPKSDLIDLNSRSQAPDFQARATKTSLPATNMDILSMGFEPSTDPFQSRHYSNWESSTTDAVTTMPFLYPQLSSLMLEDNRTALFTTGTQFEGQHVLPPRIYDNVTSSNPSKAISSFYPSEGFTPLSSSHQLQTAFETLEPVSVTVNTEARSEGLPAASDTDTIKESSLPPSYYELIEFDPLADTSHSEAIYEDIDKYLFKTEVKQNTEC